MKKNIQYVTDANGKRVAAILPIEEYENLLEDLHVIAAASGARGESSRPLDDVVAELRSSGETDI